MFVKKIARQLPVVSLTVLTLMSFLHNRIQHFYWHHKYKITQNMLWPGLQKNTKIHSKNVIRWLDWEGVQVGWHVLESVLG